MPGEEEKPVINPEEITVTGSASHGFGEEDFAEELDLADEEDDEDDEKTVED